MQNRRLWLAAALALCTAGCTVLLAWGTIHVEAVDGPTAAQWNQIRAQKEQAWLSTPHEKPYLPPLDTSTSPQPQLSAEELIQFHRIVDVVMQVANDHAKSGVVWVEQRLDGCGALRECGESFLREPYATITAPTDRARRDFAVALAKALVGSGAQELKIMVAADIQYVPNPGCSPEDAKENPGKCLSRKQISPWPDLGEMRVSFAEVQAVNLDSLTGAQIDALFHWGFIGQQADPK